MSWSRLYHYSIASTLTFVIILLTAAAGNGQTKQSPPPFRAGQSVYIVAFRLIQFPIILEEPQADRQREYINYDLDAERKVRKRIEEWQFFKVAEKVSEADFIFLVNFDESSVEGLAIPYEAYRRNFKERFDLDALRDAAFGRYLIGPLKLPTLTRLSDRLVKQFQERVGKPTH
jgi:hypothetical protein